MSEAQKAQIIFLNGTSFEIFIQSTLTAAELLEIIASKFAIRELEYFGIAYIDETNHYSWLQLDKRVLDHDFPQRASGLLVLQFLIRFYAETMCKYSDTVLSCIRRKLVVMSLHIQFYAESITMCKHSDTVKLFYRQARLAVYQERTCCNEETACQLAALVLQETLGNYSDDDSACKNISRLRVLPASLLSDIKSTEYKTIEKRVIEEYRQLKGLSRGTTIVNYLRLVESLPTYGVHYYSVKDKAGNACWLGISGCGISVFEMDDRHIPKHIFRWQQLENLYFREKKFSIEVHDLKKVVHLLSSFNLYDDVRQELNVESDDLSDAMSHPTTQMSVSRRGFGGGSVKVYAWVAASTQLTKTVWLMAVSQHQFYLDRTHKKTLHRSPSEIALDLNNINGSTVSRRSGVRLLRAQSTTLLADCYNAPPMPAFPIGGSLKRGTTLQGMNHYKSLGTQLKQKDALASLAEKKKSLEETLSKRLEKLHELCLQESELTGKLPVEYRMFFGDQAPQHLAKMAPPVLSRRNSESGTRTFVTPQCKPVEEAGELSQLRSEYEIQDKIVKAALKLTKDTQTSHSVRKERLAYYEKELAKYTSFTKIDRMSTKKMIDVLDWWQLIEMERRLNSCQSSMRSRRAENSLPPSTSSSSSSLNSQGRQFVLDKPYRGMVERQSNHSANSNKGLYDNQMVWVDDSSGSSVRSGDVRGRFNGSVVHNKTKSAPASPVPVGGGRREFRHIDSTDAASSRSSKGSRSKRDGTGSDTDVLTFHLSRPDYGPAPSSSSSSSSWRQGPGHYPSRNLPGIPVGFSLDVNSRVPARHKSYDRLDEEQGIPSRHISSSMHTQGYPARMLPDNYSNPGEVNRPNTDSRLKTLQPYGFQFYNNQIGTRRSADEPSNSRMDVDAQFGRKVAGLNIEQSGHQRWNDPGPPLLMSSPSEINSKRNATSSTPHSQSEALYTDNIESYPPFNTSPFYSPPAMYPDGIDLSLLENPVHTGSIDRATTRLASFDVSPRKNLEVSKPFEMSDFYRYSERFKNQRNRELPAQPDDIPRAGQARCISALPSTVDYSSDTGMSNLGSAGRLSAGKSYTGAQKWIDAGNDATRYGVTDLTRGQSLEGNGASVRRLLPKSYFSPPHVQQEGGHNSKQNTPDMNRSTNSSFGSFNANTGLAGTFEEEMYAWYDNNRRNEVGGASGSRSGRPQPRLLPNGSERGFLHADDEQYTLV